MIISHAHRFILMSPWKTASSTCQASLAHYDESPYSRFFHFNSRLNRVVHQHLTLAELGALPEGRLGYRIGAFVRNPYDRAYSGFLQLRRDFEDQPNREFDHPWIGELVRAQIAENMNRIIAASFDFDTWIQNLPEYEVFDVGRNSNMVLHPAHYWTHIDGVQTVDFIGKVESFATDFARFCSHVGIEAPAIVAENVSPGQDDHDIALGCKYGGRMSRKSIDRINDLFALDFDRFDYRRL